MFFYFIRVIYTFFQNMPTGEIEVKASHITVLGAAPNQMPMLVKGAKLVSICY